MLPKGFSEEISLDFDFLLSDSRRNSMHTPKPGKQIESQHAADSKPAPLPSLTLNPKP